MAEKDKDAVVEVPQKQLTEMMEAIARAEKAAADAEAKAAGIEEMFAAQKGAEAEGGTKLREKKNFEPKFRTVRLRKYPIAGGPDMGYVVGWTNKGAYQEVDRTGVSPQTVDFIDIIFLGQEKTKDGKIKAEKVRLLDLMNKGIQVHCKVIEQKSTPRVEPTGEEIDVTVFDPQHGLIATGDKIDGYTAFSDTQYTIKIPDISDPVVVDGQFLN